MNAATHTPVINVMYSIWLKEHDVKFLKLYGHDKAQNRIS